MDNRKPVVDIEAERKRNVRIAIGIAAAGVTCGFIFYLLFFTAMFLFPFFFTSVLPSVSLHTASAYLDGKVLLFSTMPVFPGESAESAVTERTVMKSYENGDISDPVYIRPFYSLYSTGKEVYFFKKGLYRVFDGKEWMETETTAIGDYPKGAAGDGALWVLSSFDGSPGLWLMQDGRWEEFDLGEGAVVKVCSSSLLWDDGRLHIFSRLGNAVVHMELLEDGLHEVGRFSGAVDYRVIQRNGEIILFTRDLQLEFMARRIDDDMWGEPRKLDIGSAVLTTEFDPVIYDGRLAMVVAGPFAIDLHVLAEEGGSEDGQMLDSVFSASFLAKSVLVNLVPLVLFVVAVLLLSVIVNKYKLRRWVSEGQEVEFASLFRRFLAHAIDVVMTAVPLGVAGISLFKEGFTLENPFRFIGMIFLFIAFWLLFVLLYYSLLEGIWGKTLGKKLCGIRVLKDDFSPCSIGAGFIRTLLRMVDGMFYYMVGAISVGATLKWQRLGDLAAATVVVRDRKHQS